MKAIESLKSWWTKPWPASAPVWVGDMDDETVLEHARSGEIDLLIATKDRRPWKKTWYCVGTSYELTAERGMVIGPIKAWEHDGELLLSNKVTPEIEAYLKRVYDQAPQVYKDRIAHIEKLVMESAAESE